VRSERSMSELLMTLKEKEGALQASLRNCEAIRHELEIIEGHLTAIFRPEENCPREALDLSGAILLYVGGRTHQVPQLKRLVQRERAFSASRRWCRAQLGITARPH